MQHIQIPIMGTGVGSAGGWGCYQDPASGMWHWYAYGPKGSRQGEGHSKTQVDHLARAAHRSLQP